MKCIICKKDIKTTGFLPIFRKVKIECSKCQTTYTVSTRVRVVGIVARIINIALVLLIVNGFEFASIYFVIAFFYLLIFNIVLDSILLRKLILEDNET
jgi:hypothetical protein